MAMDVRDAMFWASEAKRKGLVRRVEAANAALLPHQDAETIRREMESLKSQLEEVGREEEIAAEESANERRILEAAERRKTMKPSGKRRRKKPPKSSKVRRI